MPDEKALVKEKLLEWEGLLNAYVLPEWDAFPALPLYMDQVIYLMNQYLSLLPKEGEEKLVTPAMINNYVKLKIIPPPVKKRYGRVHLAFLVMVCVLKQSVNTSEIRKALPLGLAEQEVQALYGGFTQVFCQEKAAFIHTVRAAAEPIFQKDGLPVTRLIFQAATSANLSRLLAQQVLGLYPLPENKKEE